MSQIRIHDTLTNSKKELEFSDKVRIYLCGVTVYDQSHIGHARTIIVFDTLRRFLEANGTQVELIQNFTDVDDKIINRAKEQGESASGLSSKYIQTYFEDSDRLNIRRATNYPKATEHIDDMINLIQKLVDNESAYVSKNGVYFRVSKFSEYGKLSKKKTEDLESGARIEVDESKESPLDFALWKFSDEQPNWESPWGKGRPGWHIECSAMSNETLGEHFDIHCGGVDNMFPHHENEIAQSVCASGRGFVNYWLHSEFLLVDGGKMSKSLGNFYTMKDLKERNFSAESIRFQLLSGHYRTKISFSLGKKIESDKVIQRINDFYRILVNSGANDKIGNNLPDVYIEFVDAMNDDLNTPKALAVFFTWMKNQMKLIKTESMKDVQIESAWNFMKIFNNIFGFIKEDKLELSGKVEKLVELREIARIEKDWILSDDLRNQISKEGWSIEDTPNGPMLKKL